MNLIEQSCVGCGSSYMCHEPMVGTSLYCTSTCENNHSLFKEREEEPSILKN